ncbi:MAG: histidinol phosphatase [Bacilli bacterium]|nr:histidinol phosphatase [Bacilli bacterium]
MKIDFHCHTKKTKSSEKETRNVDKNLFRKKIVDSDVKLVAITNHNCFDLNQFNDFEEEVKDICILWPGVELDILQLENKNGHLIIICDPKEKKEFNKILQDVFGTTLPDDFSISVEDLYSKIKSLNCIYIAHYYKKEPSLSEKTLAKLEELVIEKHRIFKEPSNYRTLGVFSDNDYNVIIGTDVHDWNEYEKCTFSELKLEIDEFEHFVLLSKKEESVVKTLLSHRLTFPTIVYPHKTVPIKCSFYREINVLFGDKGTGKTEMLKSLEKKFLEKRFSISTYYGVEKTATFTDLIKLKDKNIKDTKMAIKGLEDSFKYIREWQDEKITSIDDYILWGSTKNTNANKKKFKLCNLNYNQSADNTQLEYFCTTEKEITDIVKYFELFDFARSLNTKEILKLNDLLNKILNKQKDFRKNEWIVQKTINLTNFSISKIKNLSDKFSNSKSKPGETGISKFIKNRVKLKNTIKKILNEIDSKEDYINNYLGTLPEKGELYKITHFKSLNKNSVKDEFDLKISDLKKYYNKLNKILDNFTAEDLNVQIDELNQINSEIKSINDFIGVKRYIGKVNLEEYTPSEGEKSMLLLNMRLNKDVDCYILDEPELSLGNQYISDEIVPKIQSLAKQNKFVIISTHNANIAVRTLPYLTIFRKHDNGKYITYFGNPFTNLLKNIDNDKDFLYWKDEGMRSLEGGPEAFNERRDIYDAGNKRNHC